MFMLCVVSPWHPDRGLRKNPLADEGDHCYVFEAVRETEEVVPVNAVSTWVLPSGVTVGR